MATVYNKRCLDCGMSNIHEYLNICPVCHGNNLVQDLELKNQKQENKRNKGKNIIDLPNDYTIIDIETTGLMPEYDEIIEISALKIRNNEIIDKFSTLVNPNNKIDEFIQELTGITNEMVKNAPKIENIIENFINFVSDDIVIGYNVNFDINFIYDDYFYFKKKEFSNNYIDLMRICKKNISLENYKLETVAGHYNISVEGHHRSLKDCLITFEIFNKTKKEILSKYANCKEFYKQNWYYQNKNLAKDIKQTVDNIDTTGFLYNKVCVFTGALNIPRKDAMQLVVNKGGMVSDTLNKKTNLLIVGTQDYTKTKENGKSLKMLKAEKMILKGQDLQIISDNEFYDLVNEE